MQTVPILEKLYFASDIPFCGSPESRPETGGVSTARGTCSVAVEAALPQVRRSGGSWR